MRRGFHAVEGTRVLNRDQRVRLRELLTVAHPWVDQIDRGPRAVTAGECGVCGALPRLLVTCGPGAPAAELCRTCAADMGVEAWCDGHREQAEADLLWAASLPDDWAAVCRLWWVATGEVALDPSLLTANPPLAELISQAQGPDG